MSLLPDLHRIHLGNLFDPRPDKPLWGDCPMWDIPGTMMGAIRSASKNVKAMTFRPTGGDVDQMIRDACQEKDIIVVWARPPLFERYLDVQP